MTDYLTWKQVAEQKNDQWGDVAFAHTQDKSHNRFVLHEKGIFCDLCAFRWHDGPGNQNQRKRNKK